MRGTRGRRILHARSPRTGRDPERIGIEVDRRPCLLRTARRQHLLERFFPRGARPHGEVCAGAGEDHIGRSVRRNSRCRAARPALRQSRSLPRRCLLAPRSRAHRLRPSRRKSRARLRSPHQEQRRRIVRRGHRTQGAGEFARFRGRVQAFILLGGSRADRPDSRRSHAARLLVFRSAHAHEARCAGKSRQGCGGTHVTPLGARKAKTAQAPIVFDPMVSTCIFEHIFEGVNGDSVYRGASFLAGKLGQKIAGDNVNIIDDGTIAGGFGTSPFDGEGVPTRRTVVVENGVLKSYLLNTYTAKKLGLQTTGNASRGLAGTPGIGPGNYFLQSGAKTPKELISGIKEGLYVTEFLGQGVNLVTGDYSRGASGMWISGGEFAYPVEEITVAGNLKELFFNISEIANDLEFRGSVAAPTIRVDGLTVGGE